MHEFRQKKVKEQARRTVEKLKKWEFHDSPYAKGGPQQDQAPQMAKGEVRAKGKTYNKDQIV